MEDEGLSGFIDISDLDLSVCLNKSIAQNSLQRLGILCKRSE